MKHALLCTACYFSLVLILWCSPATAISSGGQPATTWSTYINDLDALLKLRARDNRVSLVSFNLSWSKMLDNYLHALRKYGKVHNYLVAATTSRSAHHCIKHNVPCWNASSMLQSSSAVLDEEQLFQTGHFKQVTWAKVVIAREVIRRGYDIHYGDVDTVYYRDVWANFLSYADHMHVDGVAMAEYDTFNTGNYYFVSNARTVAFFDAWLLGANNSVGLNDQLWLPQLSARYKRCCTRAECQALSSQKGRTYAVVAGHVAQNVKRGDPQGACMAKNHCPPKAGSNLCNLSSIYQHAICLTGTHQKSAALKGLGLWFLHERLSAAPVLHAQLPCDEQLAWSGAFNATP
jgi:hypothetical protein